MTAAESTEAKQILRQHRRRKSGQPMRSASNSCSEYKRLTLRWFNADSNAVSYKTRKILTESDTLQLDVFSVYKRDPESLLARPLAKCKLEKHHPACIPLEPMIHFHRKQTATIDAGKNANETRGPLSPVSEVMSSDSEHEGAKAFMPQKPEDASGYSATRDSLPRSSKAKKQMQSNTTNGVVEFPEGGSFFSQTCVDSRAFVPLSRRGSKRSR